MAFFSGYTELEYIESTGTQYINTGFVPNQNTEISVTSSLNNTGTTHDGCLLGARNTTSDQFLIWFNDMGGSPIISPRFKSTNIASVSVNYNQKVNCSMNKNGAVINGISYSISTASISISYNLLLFALNNTGVVDSRYFTGKLYDCKIYDNGSLIRDFIPARRQSDEAVGLYDKVNNVFYTNAGTGSFLAGPAVEPTQFRIMIGQDSYYACYIGNEIFIPAYQNNLWPEQRCSATNGGDLPLANGDTLRLYPISYSNEEPSLNMSLLSGHDNVSILWNTVDNIWQESGFGTFYDLGNFLQAGTYINVHDVDSELSDDYSQSPVQDLFYGEWGYMKGSTFPLIAHIYYDENTDEWVLPAYRPDSIHGKEFTLSSGEVIYISDECAITSGHVGIYFTRSSGKYFAAFYTKGGSGGWDYQTTNGWFGDSPDSFSCYTGDVLAIYDLGEDAYDEQPYDPSDEQTISENYPLVAQFTYQSNSWTLTQDGTAS